MKSQQLKNQNIMKYYYLNSRTIDQTAGIFEIFNYIDLLFYEPKNITLEKLIEPEPQDRPDDTLLKTKVQTVMAFEKYLSKQTMMFIVKRYYYKNKLDLDTLQKVLNQYPIPAETLSQIDPNLPIDYLLENNIINQITKIPLLTEQDKEN